MPEWRIDTLDPRGGLAFATWWDDANSSDGPGATPEPYCIFVGAPDFRPEVVANRSTALAAGRGAFQIGLFLEDAEVPFPTPTAIAEFVRRVYLRGGGGDGAEGGGGETPPPRPVGGSELPPSPKFADEKVGERGLRLGILNLVAMFDKVADGVALGHPKRYRWPNTVDLADAAKGAAAADDGPNMLGAAAVRLIYEMARRLPSSGDPHALARWQRDARTLGSLLSRLDLWPLLFSEPYHPLLADLVTPLLQNTRSLALLDVLKGVPDNMRTGLAMYLLFVDGPPMDDHEWAGRLPFGSGTPQSPAAFDPIPDLSRIPLPEGLETFIDSDLQGRANLYHALAAFMGSPASILALGSSARALIDLVLFASACIVGPDGGRPLFAAGSWQFWWARKAISPIQHEAIRIEVSNAWSWLAEHLPSLVFPEALEKIIESAAGLRYNAAA